MSLRIVLPVCILDEIRALEGCAQGSSNSSQQCFNGSQLVASPF